MAGGGPVRLANHLWDSYETRESGRYPGPGRLRDDCDPFTGKAASLSGGRPRLPLLLENEPQIAGFLLLCSTAISEALNGIHHQVDQILLMQDTIIDVRRRTQELTISEIVSREIDPVLFILLLSTEQFPSNGLMGNCHVSYAVNNYY